MSSSLLTISIDSVATAVPEFRATQEEVHTVIRSVLPAMEKEQLRALRVFEHNHIDTRHFMHPPEWYVQSRDFVAMNTAGVVAARALACEAARKALQGTVPKGVIVVNTTVITTPSLDSFLIRDLGLPSDTLRTPVFGLGCAGGVVGLSRAAELSRAHGGAPFLVVCVEVCSAAFQQGDARKSHMVGTSLFADGAGAVVVSASGGGVEVGNSHSSLFDDTEDMMGWDVSETGLRVRFSRNIPAFVEQRYSDCMNAACCKWGIQPSEIRSVIPHPGGAKVLDAIARAGNWPDEWFIPARNILRRFGNMSSASVIFVLEEMFAQGIPHGYSVMSALGPGFSSEMLLLYSRSSHSE